MVSVAAFTSLENLMKHPIFEDLFVLELANNHWGKLERGLKIVQDFGQVVRFNGMKAAYPGYVWAWPAKVGG